MQQLTLVQEVQWLLFIKLMFWINCKYYEGVLLLSNFNQQHIAEYKFIELDAWKINLQKCTYCTQIFKSTFFFWLCVPSKYLANNVHLHYIMCRGVWNPPSLLSFHPLYQTTRFTKTNINMYPPFCRSSFSKINMMQIYTIPLKTAIFLTSKPCGGIKLVWIWRISTLLSYLST